MLLKYLFDYYLFKKRSSWQVFILFISWGEKNLTKKANVYVPSTMGQFRCAIQIYKLINLWYHLN